MHTSRANERNRNTDFQEFVDPDRYLFGKFLWITMRVIYFILNLHLRYDYKFFSHKIV